MFASGSALFFLRFFVVAASYSECLVPNLHHTGRDPSVFDQSIPDHPSQKQRHRMKMVTPSFLVIWGSRNCVQGLSKCVLWTIDPYPGRNLAASIKSSLSLGRPAGLFNRRPHAFFALLVHGNRTAPLKTPALPTSVIFFFFSRRPQQALPCFGLRIKICCIANRPLRMTVTQLYSWNFSVLPCQSPTDHKAKLSFYTNKAMR